MDNNLYFNLFGHWFFNYGGAVDGGGEKAGAPSA